MTCKECVHYEPCYSGGCSFWNNIEQTEEDHCPLFKNKADFVEVKHGEWIVEEELKTPLSHAYIRKEKTYHCPYCNKQYRQKMNFCGNCGADMRKEGADNEQRD